MSGEPPNPVRYEKAKDIWDTLQCRNMDDFTCLYNLMDTIDLGVICEERRMGRLKDYLKLDVRNYMSISVYGAAWAKYKCRSITQSINKEDVLEAIEDATHGGYSCVSLRRAVSSRFYEPMFVPAPSCVAGERVRVMSTIEALDENNQYGHKMIQKLCSGGFRRRIAPENVLMSECREILRSYTADDDRSYMFQVDMVLPKVQHAGAEERFPSVFEREECNLESLSPYQLVHLRRPSKLKRRKYNKVYFTVKNMGTMWRKKRDWVNVDLLQLQVDQGWFITRVHTYYSYLQSYTMKAYIEENQKRRMQSTDPVTIKLMKDTNNKAFRANTQCIRNRKKVVPIIDKVVEHSRACEDEVFAQSIASLKERSNMIWQDYEDAVVEISSLNKGGAFDEVQILTQNRDAHLQRLDNCTSSKEDCVDRVSKSWRGEADEVLYQHIRQGKARTVQVCDEAKSVQTEQETKVNVKSSRFVGTHILAKAEVSIVIFAHGVCDTFDPMKNPAIVKDMQKMGLSRVVPSIILTDTDSVYVNFIGVFTTVNPTVEGEEFQLWVRNSIIIFNYACIDTSNLVGSLYRCVGNKKKLNMFQFDTATPNIPL